MHALLFATDDLALRVSVAFGDPSTHTDGAARDTVLMSGRDDNTTIGTGGPTPGEEGSDVQTRIRVLIVEDEALVATDLAFRLEDLGYATCGTAATADDAVALAETQRPELILMDVNLHGSRDGVDAAESIRQNDNRVRIIFVTAYSDPSTRDRMARAGGRGVVTKPYTDQELAQAIKHAMAKRSEQ